MIVSPDASGHIDHPVLEIAQSFDSDDITLVPITFYNLYQFNDKLYELKKWVLVDFCEYGANHFTMQKTHLWGANSHLFPQVKEEYLKFDQFVKDNAPVLILKRELLYEDAKDNLYPIDFPAKSIETKRQSKEDFDKRPVSICHWWGHSHESRRALHGNIFLHSSKRGYGVVDNFYHFDGAIKDYKEVWATIQVPHYARIPMEDVLRVNGNSKLSVSLPGAGIKCFRHTECSVNSIMVMRDDNLAWSYEWEHGVNCIKIPLDIDNFEEVKGRDKQWRVIETIEKALKRDDLHEIYLNGLKTSEKYYLPNYIKDYITPIINKHK